MRRGHKASSSESEICSDMSNHGQKDTVREVFTHFTMSVILMPA